MIANKLPFCSYTATLTALTPKLLSRLFYYPTQMNINHLKVTGLNSHISYTEVTAELLFTRVNEVQILTHVPFGVSVLTTTAAPLQGKDD